MADPYVGEIRMFAGNYAPAGWQFCDGSLLPISEYETLFQLIGTTYGGDGQNTYAVPDMRGRIPVHFGNTHVLGEMAGTEQVTLGQTQIPAHNHTMMANNSVANTPNPGNNLLGLSTQVNMFFSDPANGTMAPGTISNDGGNQPHDNVMPYLCVNFIISLFGIFPSPA
jgi:microcystin-dependent protein